MGVAVSRITGDTDIYSTADIGKQKGTAAFLALCVGFRRILIKVVLTRISV